MMVMKDVQCQNPISKAVSEVDAVKGLTFIFAPLSVLTQINVPDDGSAECLVASFHVSEIDVCAHV